MSYLKPLGWISAWYRCPPLLSSLACQWPRIGPRPETQNLLSVLVPRTRSLTHSLCVSLSLSRLLPRSLSLSLSLNFFLSVFVFEAGVAAKALRSVLKLFLVRTPCEKSPKGNHLVGSRLTVLDPCRLR